MIHVFLDDVNSAGITEVLTMIIDDPNDYSAVYRRIGEDQYLINSSLADVNKDVIDARTLHATIQDFVSTFGDIQILYPPSAVSETDEAYLQEWIAKADAWNEQE